MTETDSFWAEKPYQNPEVTWREYQRGIMTEVGLAMNPTAAFVFKNCDGARTVAELISSYQQEYGIDEETARTDVRSVVEELLDQKTLLTGDAASGQPGVR